LAKEKEDKLFAGEVYLLQSFPKKKKERRMAILRDSSSFPKEKGD
jgi:hypothetical protein